MNWVNFHWSTQSLKNCTFKDLFRQKHIMSELENLKGDAKFTRKLTCGLQNDIRNLISFHASSQKSGNLHLDGLLLSKAYKYLDEKVQKSCVS